MLLASRMGGDPRGELAGEPMGCRSRAMRLDAKPVAMRLWRSGGCAGWAIASQQGLAAKAGEIIGEVGKLGIGEAAYCFWHGSLGANTGSRLILLERFDE